MYISFSSGLTSNASILNVIMTQAYIISLKDSAPPSTRKKKQADKKVAKFVEGEV
jgi:hypothetical protein